jgi:uncharacterized protein HemX
MSEENKAPLSGVEKEKINRNGFGPLLFKLAIIIIAVLGIGVGIYFYIQYDKTQKLLKNPTVAAQAEQKDLIKAVSKLIELPKDEEPTIATVSDVNKLKGQAFFAKAQNGFKVLIYPKSKKAILYDPKANKIIEVGPINIGDKAAQPASTGSTDATVKEPVKVAIYNGTKTSGLAGTTEKQLKEKMSNVTVVAKGNAKENYTKTLVVDLTGKQKSNASEIAKNLNGEVGSLPQAETAPASNSAQILIIVGAD